MATMLAAVVHEAGGPEVLKLKQVPLPVPAAGEVLIRVRAFGLNRSEMFTRQGLSPNVKLPRILGIEATGAVESAPGGEFAPGTTVASVMGGLGRDIDGGYAEFVKIPAKQVQAVTTTLAWEMMGALPEMLQTAWGSLYKSLQLKEGETLLVRGGTTSIGLAAAAIAAARGVHVVSTSRKAESESLLRKSGAADFVLDTGTIAEEVRARLPKGVNKVLELIGVTTLKDSLRCAGPGGLVCMTGIVGNKWSFDEFAPMEAIPTSVGLTVYAGESADFMAMPFQELVTQVENGSLPVQVGRTFKLTEIVEAHRVMEANTAAGKIVGLPG